MLVLLLFVTAITLINPTLYNSNLIAGYKISFPLTTECQLHIKGCKKTVTNGLLQGSELLLSIRQHNRPTDNPFNSFSPAKSLIIRLRLNSAKKAGRIKGVTLLIDEKDRYIESTLDSGEQFIASTKYSLQQLPKELDLESSDTLVFYQTGDFPVCVVSLTEWVALLRIELDDSGSYTIPFEFETEIYDASAHEM
ncbi:MAG: hypothetical protein HOM84_06330 [Thiotrichales bacterium]|nr:hypothetical protein [Thiotrichales bacterium]MBT3613624.1 hypothetical protein [Thiotrichales bacterium]MBT3752620.1 hypothetical protein [Thiotrichales bacterium]MBT3837907.1 hypothetical protein [Thiotrichales bacterium]MBT4261608.1 hypothetical protein [Thiotrichales bacterium]